MYQRPASVALFGCRLFISLAVWSAILGQLVLSEIVSMCCAFEMYTSSLSDDKMTVNCTVSYMAYLKAVSQRLPRTEEEVKGIFQRS